MQSQREVKIRLLLFCGLTIVFLIPISILYAQGKNNMLLLLCMMTPTLSVILTRMITRESTKELYIRPQLKKHKGLYLAAWLATPIIAWTGALFYFLIFPDTFDPLHSALATENQFTSYAEYWQFCLIMIPLAILINPIMGLVQCFGEEFAWRGYLLPKLLTFLTPIKAIIVTGIIWGIWHAPFIAMGYNYGTCLPAFGVVAMILFCMILGIIQGFLFLKTRSIWASVVFHAALNGIDLWTPSNLCMVGKANPFIGPDVTGIIGAMGLIVAAFLCLVWIYKNQRSPKTRAL